MSLVWRVEPAFRPRFERQLHDMLTEIDSGANPFSGWLIGLAAGFILALFFGLATYLFLLLFGYRLLGAAHGLLTGVMVILAFGRS